MLRILINSCDVEVTCIRGRRRRTSHRSGEARDASIYIWTISKDDQSIAMFV